MRAAIYLRISQDRTGDAAGVNRQREDCEALAAEHGWEVAEIYTDNDRSATTGKPRPEFARMLADIEAGRIGAVVAWHTDRMYRKLADLERIIPTFEQHKVIVRTCRSGELDLSTPTGRMLARILGSVASHEGEQKADRWRRSYRQRRGAGRWMGSGPRTFGYNRDGTIRENEADAIRQAATDILQGVGMQSICRAWTDAGYRSTRGGVWAPTTLRQLLSNPRLAGLATENGEIVGPAATPAEGGWLPILDRGTWERLCALIAARKDGHARSPARSLLSGVAVCGFPVDGAACGNPLTRGATSIPVYQCRTSTWSSRHVTVSALPLERLTEAAARKALRVPKVQALLAAQRSNGDAERITEQIADIEARIRDLESALGEAGGRMSAQSLRRAIDDLGDRLVANRHRLAAIAHVAIPVDIDADWPTDLERRAALIRVVVAKVWVDPAKKRGARFDPSRIRIDPVT